jgi:hypothetical protein
LLTFRAEGHAGFDRSECVAAVVTSYLIDLTLPRRRAACVDEVQPTPPPAAHQSSTGKDAASKGVDESLETITVR